MLGPIEYPVFLAKGQDEAAIFEGGVGATAPVVAEQLAALDIGADIVKEIVVTHAHPDHVMAVGAFREMFSNAAVCASKIAAGASAYAWMAFSRISTPRRREPISPWWTV